MPDNLQPADPLNPYADYSFQQMFAFLKDHDYGHAGRIRLLELRHGFAGGAAGEPGNDDVRRPAGQPHLEALRHG
ncbi:MAG: hypothetical protein R3C10_11765 [Pirellulales bacterium]